MAIKYDKAIIRAISAADLTAADEGKAVKLTLVDGEYKCALFNGGIEAGALWGVLLSVGASGEPCDVALPSFSGILEMRASDTLPAGMPIRFYGSFAQCNCDQPQAQALEPAEEGELFKAIFYTVSI